MNYDFIKELIDLGEVFEKKDGNRYPKNISGFKKWVADKNTGQTQLTDPEWEGKESGRSSDSVINTLIVHLNRYAKSYSRSAMIGSEFSSQEDFIYLICLKAFGSMSKMDLIRKNVHEKPVGMLIINRLIHHGWVEQFDSNEDKRSKIIEITTKGLAVLEKQMGKIRQASRIVTGNLSSQEKIELIRLLKKLDDFHKEIYDQNIEPAELLEKISIINN